MTKSYDVIILGCGIIGNCIAFELSKIGYKTLSIDRLGGSGFGSTAASCAIVRAHYSIYDGVAFAYEGFHIWENWGEYCEIEDPDGMAVYHRVGSIMLKSRDLVGLAGHAVPRFVLAFVDVTRREHLADQIFDEP